MRFAVVVLTVVLTAVLIKGVRRRQWGLQAHDRLRQRLYLLLLLCLPQLLALMGAI